MQSCWPIVEIIGAVEEIVGVTVEILEKAVSVRLIDKLAKFMWPLKKDYLEKNPNGGQSPLPPFKNFRLILCFLAVFE